MKTLIIVGHPAVAESTTQQFLKAAAAPVSGASWHELPAATPVAQLAGCERLVLQFPLYWYQAPALVGNWLTQTLAQPGATAALAGKTLGLVVACGQPEAAFQAGGRVGVTLDALLAPYVALTNKLGMHLLPKLVVAQFAYQSPAAHQALLVRYQQYLSLQDPTSFAQVAAWWQTQLRQRADQQAAEPALAARLHLVADTLATRQDALANLQDALAELEGGTTLG
ncbi:NAD(P)H-dependent oxidoreductase [Lacticaseibacillus suihuaensis]